MESTGRQDSVSDTPAGGGSEVGPGLRKVRPKANSRIIETNALESARSNKTFSNPVSVSIPTGYSAADFEVPHTLGSVPSDVLFGTRSVNTTIWRGDKSWTRTAIYLRAGTAVTVTLYMVP